MWRETLMLERSVGGVFWPLSIFFTSHCSVWFTGLGAPVRCRMVWTLILRDGGLFALCWAPVWDPGKALSHVFALLLRELMVTLVCHTSFCHWTPGYSCPLCAEEIRKVCPSRWGVVSASWNIKSEGVGEGNIRPWWTDTVFPMENIERYSYQPSLKPKTHKSNDTFGNGTEPATLNIRC